MDVQFLVSIKHPDDAEPMFLTEQQAKELHDALHAKFGDFDQARELSQLARESVARELRLTELECYVQRLKECVHVGPSLQDDIEAMIAQNSKNGEELRLHSLVLRVDGLDQTLLTTPDYWDCECDENYIHFHQAERCPRCGAERDSQPDARVFELLKHAPENAAWKFIGPDGITVPVEVINERLRVYAESLRDPFAPDDADEQEAEFLSRLPLSEVCQLPPIKHPSNTPAKRTSARWPKVALPVAGWR
jgi:hypothetical protein